MNLTFQRNLRIRSRREIEREKNENKSQKH